MTWLQLRLDTQPEDVSLLEDLMLASGCVAVTLEDNADQPVLEPGVGETPLWQHTRLTGLYAADADMDAVLATFPDDLLTRAAARVEILEDKDWEREWMQHYQPMRFGSRLWVCPSWQEPPEPGAINLLLDPGLAFGTGTHPTTALCLEQLDGIDMTAPDNGPQVVDYGCGSGILAVAALKLGASRALGIDNDPQALVASRDNAERNGIDPARLELALPGAADEQAWVGQADIVVANILAGPLLQLSDTLLTLMRPGATLLMAGLLQSQAQGLIAHYQPHIKLAVASEREGWVCLRGRLSENQGATA
ncbi:MAG: 50S ribosomal protein L11 methyltransferase [Pseudomonadota bacterium]